MTKRPENDLPGSAGWLYQQEDRYFIQIAEGIKAEGAKELAGIGGRELTPVHRGIHFKASKKDLYRIVYNTRLASRCLVPLLSFKCTNTDDLYTKAKQVCWEDLIAKSDTFAVSGNVSDSSISHSKFASLRLKDAIVDRFREKSGYRPDVSKINPDILLNLHIRKDFAEIGLDASGEALHKRGYREETISAPMQETVAAAIIRLSEWDGSIPLYDPMCGSGTLLCEALMDWCHIPAGIFRTRFGFERLPDFDDALWHQVRKEAETDIRELPEGLIAGSDISKQAVNAAKTNLMGLHFGKNVRINRCDFKFLPPIEGSVLVANPPYGKRMGREEDLDLFYKNFGDFLKRRCRRSSAYVYFGERRFLKKIGLRSSWKKPVRSGGLDGRLAKFDIY